MTSGLPWRRRLAAAAVRAADRVVPPSRTVVLHSQPDLDDNVVALLRGRPPGVTAKLLVDSPERASRRATALGLEAPLVPRRSLRGVMTYLRATVTISTHGLMGSPRRGGRRQSVGLWHGEFGKRVGRPAGEPRRHFDWMPVSSELSRDLRCAEFELEPDRVAVIGSPRQSLLARSHASAPGPRDRYVLWAPTYRSTTAGRARTDGDPARVQRTLQPDDPDLVALLARHGASLWFRPHPADTTSWSTESARLARDEDLEPLGLTFYEVLAGAACLVTDYSSLWVDHLLCDRPMISFCPDLDDFRSGRGLALEPHEDWFPGPVVRTRWALIAALSSVLDGQDDHAQRRAAVRRRLHTAADDPVGAVWSRVVQATRDEPERAAAVR